MTLPPLCTIVVNSNASNGSDLRSLLGGEPQVHVVEECQAVDVVVAIQRHNPDLILLNIQGDDASQFSSAAKCFDFEKPVIVVASEGDHAIRALEIGAIDFLILPLDKKRLHQAIEKARRQLNYFEYARLAQYVKGLLQNFRPHNQPDQLVCRTNGRVLFLDLNEIDWIGAAAKHVQLNVGPESYVVRERIGELSKRLDPERFVRIHRSVIVNVRCIKELQPCSAGEYLVVLKNGKKLPSSRGYRAELEQHIAKCVRITSTSH